MTLRMLANMTSGLYSYTFDKKFVHDLYFEPHRPWTPRKLVNIAFKREPPVKPGTGFQYCNTNTVLLGVILQKVTGKSIADDFQRCPFNRWA